MTADLAPQGMTRGPLTRWSVRAASCAVTVATPVAAWWVVGDQSTVPEDEGPDYFLRPFAIDARIEMAAGIGALALAVVAVAILIAATRTRRMDPSWWAALVPVIIAGVFIGLGWRALTAGVIGANIGAGMVALFGGPVVAMLLTWAIAWSAVLLIRARRRNLTDN